MTRSTTWRISVGSGIRAGVTPESNSPGLALPLSALDILRSQRSRGFAVAGFALAAGIEMKLCSRLVKLLVIVMVFWREDYENKSYKF